MVDVELRELRYFVAVAQELSFSKAAERLGITQPPLSRSIAKMERTIGTRLFDRSTHHVTLTKAGATLLREADIALDAVSAAVTNTQRAGAQRPRLVATAKPGIASGLLRRIVNHFARSAEGIDVHIIVSPYRRQTDIIRSGRADVGLLNSPFDAGGLKTRALTSEQRVAALPAGHHLADRTFLNQSELEDEPVAVWPDATRAEWSYWCGKDYLPAPAGASDLVVGSPVVHDAAELFEVVGLGQVVAVIPVSAAEAHPRPDIVYMPITDAVPAVTAIAWRAGAVDKPIADFVASAVEVAAVA